MPKFLYGLLLCIFIMCPANAFCKTPLPFSSRMMPRIHPPGQATVAGALLIAPSPPRPGSKSLRDTWKIFARTLWLATLIFLPGISLAAFAVSKEVRGTVKLGLILLAGIAIPGYSLFWIYLFSAKAGYWIGVILPFACSASLFFLIRQWDQARRRRMLPLIVPCLLTFLAALSLLSLGFDYGGIDALNRTARDRFMSSLPHDNELPFIFAEGLRTGKLPRPLDADWLSSDRPPLQAGMILALEPFMSGRRELWYQISSTILQSLWVFAAWLLLKSFRCSHLTVVAILLTGFLSGTSLVNGFFVWPKLLAAAYLMAFAIPILAARKQTGGHSFTLLVTMAFLLATGLLAHGGSAFALLGLLPFTLIRFRKSTFRRRLALVAGLALLFYSPWVVYQKFVDPPGDRLLKYHFAGVEAPTPEPALKIIVGAYRHQSLAQWQFAKRANYVTLVGSGADYLKQIQNFTAIAARQRIRVLEFYYLVPSIGLVLVGILGLLSPWTKRGFGNEKRPAVRMLIWVISISIPFILLMFKPFSTVLHQGTYILVLGLTASSILAFRSVTPRLALTACAAACIIRWFTYAPDFGNWVIPNPSPHSINPWLLALHLVALAAFIGVLSFKPPARLHSLSQPSAC